MAAGLEVWVPESDATSGRVAPLSKMAPDPGEPSHTLSFNACYPSRELGIVPAREKRNAERIARNYRGRVNPAALGGSQTQASGSAGGYLLCTLNLEIVMLCACAGGRSRGNDKRVGIGLEGASRHIKHQSSIASTGNDWQQFC